MIAAMQETSKIEEWLDALPEDEIQRELDEYQAQLEIIAREVNKRRELLDMKRRWRDFYGVGRPEPQPPDTAQGPSVTLFPERPSSIRGSVLEVIASDASRERWSAQLLKAKLVERGWMEDTTKAMRSLLSALSRMTADGELVRVGHGIYRSVAQDAAAQAFSGQGEEPD